MSEQAKTGAGSGDGNERRCSICGRGGELTSFGPGPHAFHTQCINGAWNYIALVKEIGGDTTIGRMAVWASAEEAGIEHPFPPFRGQDGSDGTDASDGPDEAPVIEGGGDVCTLCGAPIDHGDPHMQCDGCRERVG